MSLGLRLGAAARGERNTHRERNMSWIKKKFPIRSFEKPSLNNWSGYIVLVEIFVVSWLAVLDAFW
jgi:hypothetical protein